jgi:hypothetical protein
VSGAEVSSEATPGPRARGLSERLAATLRLGPFGLGCATTALLVAVQALWEIATGHADHLLHPELDQGDQGVSLLIEVLIGFAVAMNVALRRAALRGVEELRPLLRGGPAEHAAFLERAARVDPLRAGLASLLAVPVGLLLVIDLESGGPYLLSGKPLNHSLVYGLLLNLVLFALIGRRIWDSFDKWRLFASLEERVERIDLLDVEALAPFARRGLREAVFWVGGSSIASLLFVSVPLHWGTILVMIATAVVGSASFLLPMLGIHRRIRAAKQAELARVREAIRRARDAGLRVEGAEADRFAARLPALLAWEARVERVREWPWDAPTLARFAVLVVLGVGSWLGGALVERVLNLLLG